MIPVSKSYFYQILIGLAALLLISACSTGPGRPSTEKPQPKKVSGAVEINAKVAIAGIQKQLKNREYKQALEKVEELIRLDGQNSAYHLLKAKILKGQGKEQQALDYLTDQVQQHPGNPGLLAARGQYLLENDYIESARRDFLSAYQQNYRSVDILKVLMVIERNNGNFKESLKLNEEALKLKPDDHKLWFEKARLQLRLSQPAAARESAANAIRLSGMTLKYHQLYLEILGYLKDGAEINRHIRLLAEKFPDDAWVSIRFATLLYTTGERDRAKMVLIRAIDKHPDNYLLQFQLATVYAADKNWQASSRLFEAGLKIKPDSTWAIVQLSKIYYQQGQSLKMIEYLQRARAKKSRDPFVYETLAKYYNRQNDTFEAEEIILEGLTINRKNQRLLLEYAGLLEKRANYREAIKAYEKALASQPDDHVILGRLGNLYRLLSDYERSQSFFIRAIDIKPDASWVRSYYVELLTDMEDWQEALAEIDKIISTTPDDYWAYAKKAQIQNELGEFENANRSVKRAISIRPGAPWLKEIEGNSLEALGQHKAAESSFKKALVETPDSAYLLTRLAYVQLHLDRKAALDNIEAALDKEDFSINTIELYLFLTGQYSRFWGFKEKSPESRVYGLIVHKQFGEAERLLKHPHFQRNAHQPFLKAFFNLLKKEDRPILGKDAGCSNAKSDWHCFYAGMDAIRKKEWNRAKVILNKGLANNPDNIWLMIKLAYVYQHLEEFQPAIDLLEQYLAKRPADGSTWVKLRLALNFDLSQQYRKAEAVYMEILASDPGDNVALNNLAWMYLTAKNRDMHKVDEALKLALKAVKLSPSPANLDTLAEAYYQKEEYQKALKTVEQALDRDRRGLDDFKKTKKKILKAIEASKKKQK